MEIGSVHLTPDGIHYRQLTDACRDGTLQHVDQGCMKPPIDSRDVSYVYSSGTPRTKSARRKNKKKKTASKKKSKPPQRTAKFLTLTHLPTGVSVTKEIQTNINQVRTQALYDLAREVRRLKTA